MFRWLLCRNPKVRNMSSIPEFCRTVRLVFDWDGTLTKHDSLSALAHIGLRYSDGKRPVGIVPPTWSGSTWEWIVEEYLEDCKASGGQNSPLLDEKRTAEEELGLINSVEHVEHRSIQRVIDTGLFKGLTKRQVLEGASDAVDRGEVVLRDGWSELLMLALTDLAPASLRYTGVELQILSVNWSATFIQACVDQSARMIDLESSKGTRTVAETVQSLRIIANEIDGLGNRDGSSGTVNFKGAKAMALSRDKVNALLSLSGYNSRAYNDSIIYVGDSVTDLECLLSARVGIVIQDDPMGSGQQELSKSLQRIRVPVKDLDELIVEKQLNLGKMLFKVNSLHEITRCLPRVLDMIHESRYT